MHFLTGLVALICASLVTSASVTTELFAKRAHDSVPAHISQSTTFYRAITREETSSVNATYPKGASPTTHKTAGGDFTWNGKGGLYVFDNQAEAEYYGKCYTIPPKFKEYYIVTFHYTPNPKLHTKSFTKPDAEWAKFVDDCYDNKPHTYDIVEGPYSMGGHGKRKGAMEQVNGGQNMLWQAAFIGPNALKTLKVTDVRKVTPGGAATGCKIM